MKLKKQEIIQQLKREILDLTLKPGDLLSEGILTERFQLSRTPIRDILKQLEAEGYIKIYPQRGSIVSYIDLDSVEQIIFLRNTLEKEVFKNLKSGFTLSMAHNLGGILRAQESCIQDKNDLTCFLKQDDIFHQTCFKYAGREFLWDVIQQFNVHYLRYRELNMQQEEKLSELIEEHRTLLKYLQNTEDINIDKLMNHHLQSDLTTFEFTDKFDQFIFHEE